MAQLGFRTINEMVGRCDVLEMNDAIDHWKARGLDMSPILRRRSSRGPTSSVYCTKSQNHWLDEALDNELIEGFWASIAEGIPDRVEMPIENIDRAFGTMLSHRISKNWGPDGLPDGTIHIKATGSAGQSLGAWLAHGVTIELEGDANDYVGKGLSGGRIIVYPPKHGHVPARREHHDRQRRPVWGHPRRGLFPRPGGRTVLRAEFGRDGRRSRESATTAANT